MIRVQRALLALSIILISANSAFGQKEPPQTKELKEAEKFVASSMTARDSADRKSRLERALNPLQQAMARDPDNARVWLVAGEVYAALADYPRADSAFTRAQQLHPPYAEQVNNERLRAWADAFRVGVSLMDERKYEDAIKVFEAAELIYTGRPESKMNLAALYANAGDAARAEATFRKALALTTGPAKASLSAEDSVQWLRFAEMSTINLAQMIGQQGIAAFEAERYDEAIKAFRDAHELNPHARDYSYNLAQSLYAKARAIDQERTDLLEQEKAARAKKDVATANARAEKARGLAAQLVSLYTEVEPLTVKARAVDPNNEDLFLLLMRAYKVRADFSADGAAKAEYQKRTSELLGQHQALTAEVTGISITPGGGEATVRGTLRNLKLKPGSQVKVRVQLLGLDGSVVGQQEAVITAPAAQETAPFEVQVSLNGELAAWKYEVVS